MGSIPDAVKLSSELSGRILCIPNLEPIFEHWHSAVNPHLDRLREEIDGTLERTVKDERKLKALKSCDFALLTSCLYPQSGWEVLRVAGTFMLWIFLWDDEIDDGGTLISQSECHAKAYCQNSLEYAHWVLGLNTKDGGEFMDTDFQTAPCLIPTMLYFRDICQVLRKAMDLEKRQRLFQEMGDYMIWTTKEQAARESGQVLTPDQYIELRNWTSGIYPVIAIFEYIAQVQFDDSLIKSDDMTTIWKETCFLCMLINDIHSAKKELASGSVLNAIPVFFQYDHAKDLSKVMADIVAKLVLSRGTFDKAATRLMSQLAGNQLQPQMVRYLDTCRTTVTGLLAWSLSTPRYGLSNYRDTDGRVIVTL